MMMPVMMMVVVVAFEREGTSSCGELMGSWRELCDRSSFETFETTEVISGSSIIDFTGLLPHQLSTKVEYSR